MSRGAFCALAIVVGCGAAQGGLPNQASDPIARVAASLLPAVHVTGAAPNHFSLDARMDHYKVPGVSIAVADHGQIVWARGFGVKEAGSSDAVVPTTLFEAGSISKPVTATATLRLVDEGKISLDADINTILRSWHLPDNEFTAAEKVNLRRIMSHTAGTNVHGFPGYVRGEPLPSLNDILEGQRPANTAAIRVEGIPGSKFRYSGGGVTIEQLALIDLTHKSFPSLMKELVLDPLGMSHSTFDQPLGPSLADEAAAAHDVHGKTIPGRAHVYPEMAAAGLWSTPTDLLTWAIEIGAEFSGKSHKLLSQDMAKQMLTPTQHHAGLGPFVEGSGRAFHFGHDGVDEGFDSKLVYFPETGQGAAIMVNGERGVSLLNEIVYAISAEYHWPDLTPSEIVTLPMDQAAIDKIVGDYQAPYEAFVITANIHQAGNHLFLRMERLGWDTEVALIAKTTLVTLDGGDHVELVTDATGKVTALKLGDIAIPRVVAP